MAAKEEKLEKEPEKPAWFVEAEARRKLHEQRRHPKSKEQGESETSLGPEKPVNNGPVLKSLPQKPEVGKKNSVGGGVMSVFRNIVLRPVRKPDAVPTKSEDDSDATKSFNVCLRPVSKAGPLDNQADEIKGSFQPVRLKPIAPRLARPLSSSVTNTEATPLRTRTPLEKTSSSQSVQLEKTAREYHTIPPLAPITLERSEPRVSESFSSPTNGERVTISSNYLSGPHKLPPSTTPKPSNRSKTVTVTASEVPQLSSVKRRSVELIQARVEKKSSGPSSSAVPYGDLSGSRRGSDARDRAETYDSAFRPTYTGDVLPQWKIELIEKKKNSTTSREGSNKGRSTYIFPA